MHLAEGEQERRFYPDTLCARSVRDESLEDAASLPDPDTLALEIADDLQAALDEFLSVSRALSATVTA